MGSYSFFADYYDQLTDNVGYKQRADYICRVMQANNHNFGLTLDLACGTGSLTLELKKQGVDIFGADMSGEMLSCAQQKAAAEELDVLFLRQKMQGLDLFGTIDTCICTLDSINHLTNAKSVQKTFDKVSLFMNKGGVFLFDVNTLYKHKNILGNNTFVYDTPAVYCVWQNLLLKDGVTVEINLDFFEKINNTYTRSSESFCERAYTDDELCAMLAKSGFEVEAVYEEMTVKPPKQNSERNVYVARKISETGKVSV